MKLFSANNNAKNVVDLIENSCQKLDLKYINRPTPFDWGEDLSWIIDKQIECFVYNFHTLNLLLEEARDQKNASLSSH